MPDILQKVGNKIGTIGSNKSKYTSVYNVWNKNEGNKKVLKKHMSIRLFNYSG